MKARAALLFVLFVILALAQGPQRPRGAKPEDASEQFPGGSKQVEEMLKADHVRNVADATELARMANELKEELDKTDAHVLSAGALKKAEDIEKLAHRIRGRLRR